MSQEEDLTNYLVVVNHEEQYSIWPDFKEIPVGWTQVGESGPKDKCLQYIETVWTDMRPLSLRKQMEEWESKGQEALAANDKAEISADDPGTTVPKGEPVSAA